MKMFKINFFCLILILICQSFDSIQNMENVNSALLFTQDQSIKTIAMFSKKILKKIQAQNELYNEKLIQCYEKLGKYTRLMLLNSNSNLKRRDLFDKDTSSNYNYLNTKQNNDDNNNNNNINKFQASFYLQREFNYYLAELERNYKLINDLELKIRSLNSTVQLSNSDSSHTNEENNLNSNIDNKLEFDCDHLNGNGFIQIDFNKYLRTSNKSTNKHMNKLSVYCEDKWIVIQQRENGFETNFNRSWKEYSSGFGSLRGDFWLGLEFVHKLTQFQPYELLIELTDWSGETFVAQYDNFEIGDEEDYYRLSLSGVYSGNASQDFLEDAYYGFSSQNGAYFSTYDNRKTKNGANNNSNNMTNENSVNNHIYNLKYQQRNCAARSGGGWWFNNLVTCLPVNLNGMYVTGASAPSARGIKWQAIRTHDRNYALKKSKMKIKPKYY